MAGGNPTCPLPTAPRVFSSVTETTPLDFYMENLFRRRFGFGALCCFALSACTSGSIYINDEEGPGGGPEEPDLCAVRFEKNCGEIAEEFVCIPPGSSTNLPEEPTCFGYRFIGWNTEPDGSGEPFTTDMLVPPGTLYAQWEKLPSGPLPLSVELSHKVFAFTPIVSDGYDERSGSLKVVVSGFASSEDADGLRLERSVENTSPWLLFGPEESSFADGKKTFTIHLLYDGLEFEEAATALHLKLVDIPDGHTYAGGVHTIHVSAVDGETRERAIPVHTANVKAFNKFAGTDEGLRLHYKLTEDIVLEPVPPGESNWEPIGRLIPIGPDESISSSFIGTFDGGGHSISGLAIGVIASDNHVGYERGLFGTLGEGAIVENLGLVDVHFVGIYSVYVYLLFRGGLAGVNNGTVHNCYVAGSVTEGNGLVGHNYGTVQDSYSTASFYVTGAHLSIGGLVGYNGGTVQDSYATGSVYLVREEGLDDEDTSPVGGLVGINSGTVHNCHATGSVESNQSLVGGLIGVNNGTVRDSHATGNVKGKNLVGGLVGDNYGTVQDSHATGNVKGNGAVGGLLGGSSDEPDFGNNIRLKNIYATGSVEGNNRVGGLVGGLWWHIVLENSHATGNVQGHGEVGGLVGYNHQCTVQNSHATGNVKGNEIVGGLVGHNYGIVQKSYATGSVEGNNKVGGLVGRLFTYRDSSLLQDSYATGNVKGNSGVGGLLGVGVGEYGYSIVHNSYATGSVEGNNEVGSLVGSTNNDGDYFYYGNGSNMENSVALSPMVRQTANDDTTIGRVMGQEKNYYASILTNNHARDDMRLTYNNGASVYVPTEEPKDGVGTSAYGTEAFWEGLGWDFENVWEWNLSTKLPILRNVGGVQNHTVQAVP